ncbi:glycine betaine/L-proline ABC transporter substrate-binding protein ProX [Allomesorhizobium camelthorni]|uniref:Glycine betaine/L-proline ABC transporter substrate-binding protein ProX n=1 Tax=Allomesorhizobium camelthorni TaxID=475069 RepID=A0A6G4WGZ1_9HYPH|nr:glycine betaine/L-proline ABC transporter substrate-binding protein ProX [Mesorhizobium camelthorni]NGO53874.1 glycine betaine/L-proline ABC transporter substrate-binding protein ProX [Mesorhizobium camelthorni]
MYRNLLLAATILGYGVGASHAECNVGEGRRIVPIEPLSTVEKFFHEITYRALEKIGYSIATPVETEYATMHIAVATGDADFTASHWNVLHKAFFEEAGGSAKMTKVGKPISGAVQGYLVDKGSYDAGVRSLADFKDKSVAERFDGNEDGKADLAGCAPGWGCETVIEHHLTEVGVRDTVSHNQGAYDAIIADIIARHEQGKPILYFTWIPYWVSAVLVPGADVEWLDVPRLAGDEALYTDYNGRNLGFGIDYASYIVNNAFLEENPPVRALFEEISVDVNDVSNEAQRQQHGETSAEEIKRHADEWVAANQAEVDAWVDKACSAK